MAIELGTGTKLSISRASANGTFGAYVAISPVFNVTPPEITYEQVDVTHLGSKSREFMRGKLADNGEIGFETFLDAGSASDTLLKSIFKSGEIIQAKIEIPNGNNFTAFTYAGFLTSYSIADITLEEKITATGAIKLNGEVV